MQLKPLLVSVLFLALISEGAAAQTDPTAVRADSVKKPQNTLIITAEIRPRTEYRRGYRLVPTEDTTAAFFTNQRARINFDLKTKSTDFYLSIQDSRIWGEQDPRLPKIPIFLFEVYAEPHITDKFSIRIGRQRIMYDNQRLFAENDWRYTAASHDAVRLIYKNKIDFATELVLAFNQSAENNFTTNYKPVGFVNYKALIVHYLNWKINSNFTLTTLNTADGYQSTKKNDYKTTWMRYTSGGRLEYSSYDWYLTASGYAQYGRDSSGREISSAYYLQPEIKYTGIKDLSIRLGAEYLSGHDGTTPVNTNNNFVPLYGVAHRFMGNLDFFTAFPTDVNNAGLVNPYLFFQYQKNKFTFRAENHLFYTQNKFVKNGQVIDKYLGFENDLRMNYKANSFTDLEVGFCWADVTESMTVIRKGGDASQTPIFSYVSIKFTPSLAKISF